MALHFSFTFGYFCVSFSFLYLHFKQLLFLDLSHIPKETIFFVFIVCLILQ